MSMRLTLAAAVLLAASAPALAVDIPLPNGSFETTSANNQFGVTVTSWTGNYLADLETQNITFNQTLGAWSTFAGSAAPNGTRMVVLSNLGAGTTVLTSQTIALTSQFYFNGSYSYITDNPLGNTNRDSFDIVIDYFSDPAGTIQLLPQQVFRISDSMPALSGTPQAATGAGFTGSVFRTNTPTGFTGFSIFINQYINMFARISFVVRDDGNEDGGANTGVTGVMIDNIFINPEPGSIALFGLGGLALGGLAFRRRKLAKKNAPQA